MIVRRKRKASQLPRMIVRRSRPVVGVQTYRRIVKRRRTQGPPPRGPRFAAPSFHWRPGRGTAMAGILAGIVAVMAAGAFLAYRSPMFEISNVEVRGNERVTTATVVERVELIGERMFAADLAAAQRSLYAIPVVSAVHIERSWPNTIVIEIEERRPWGTWEQGGVGYTIDRDGVVIGTTPPPEGAPVIVSSEPGSRMLGDRVDYQAVDAAAEIYELLPRQLGTTVTEVAFLSGKGVQVTTGRGEVALLGDSGGITYKLAVWAAVASEAQGQGIAYSVIDLRYGNRPVLQ